MTKFNIHDAKTHFSALIKRAESGEEVIIARAGEPVARLVGIRKEGAVRRPGMDRGKLEIKPDFDDPIPEFEA